MDIKRSVFENCMLKKCTKKIVLKRHYSMPLCVYMCGSEKNFKCGFMCGIYNHHHNTTWNDERMISKYKHTQPQPRSHTHTHVHIYGVYVCAEKMD